MMHIFPKKRFCVFLFTLFFASSAFAQRLALPFFDDFASSSISPAKWINAGVCVYPGSPQAPSFYVATFDGRDSRGIPYVTNFSTAVGPTDSLTSQPIDLSGISTRDSLVLSFFYQAKGLGEAPDQEDSLILEVRTRQFNWQTIWSSSDESSVDFSLVMLPLADELLYHQDFQFRFRSFGRQTGPFDTWSVDYIYLDTKRDVARGFFPDIAISSIQTSLFKEYQSLPYRTFTANPMRYWSTELPFSARNLREFQSSFRYQFFVSDIPERHIFQDTQISAPLDVVGNGVSTFKIPLVGTKWPTSPQTVQFVLNLLTPEAFDDASSASVLFRQNDKIVLQNDLTDYYAYDDGTAEAGADTDKQFGEVAIRFVGLPQDTLSAIRVAFSPTFTNLIGSTIVLQVRKSNRGIPGDLVASQAVRLTEPFQKNEFIEFALTESVVVKDTFFVGWQRISTTAVPIGLDKNPKPYPAVVYQNAGGGWAASDLEGYLLFRPVMGNRTLVSGSSDGLITGVEPSLVWQIFPNPTTNLLYFNLPDGESAVFSIFDTQGRRVVEESEVRSPISLESLSSGIYFLKIKTQSHTFTKKIILSR